MRKISSILATQHPDNASAPYWESDGDGFVSISEELREAMSCYQDLGVDEFMWDWEGKYADEAVIDKLFSEHYKFFKDNQLGKEKFLTFRLPNIWLEKGYSLLRALLVILTSEDFAKDLKFRSRPLFEVILPMTEKAEQLVYIQDCFTKLARFKSREFEHQKNVNSDYLEIIPLVEDVKFQANIRKLLDDYFALYKKRFKRKPEYLRVFLARSDPAMLSGLVANVLANKIALSELKHFENETGVAMYPIIGVGSLVFRGGFNPKNVHNFIKEYAGVRTVTMQSACRYDYPLDEVKKTVRVLEEKLPSTEAVLLSKTETKTLRTVIGKFEKVYQSTLVRVVKDMVPFFDSVPKRRERKLHIGFLAYKRKIGGNYLPRAISFTSAFYSLGVPPEFIGLGQALKALSIKERELVFRHYINLEKDIAEAGKYVNKDNLKILCRKNKAWQAVEKSIAHVENIFGIELGPKTKEEWLHKNISGNVLLLKNDTAELKKLIIATGKIRKSLG
ncbi:MAG: phosphoenolpyruvate carboxylase [Patescibacteria group bacterium]|jgi:phosphoenolpyruvate carboxylase